MDKKCKKVLIVESDDYFRELLRCVLSREGFEVCTARSVEEGLEALKKYPGFCVITSGHKNSEMDGVGFFQKAREISPKSKRIMISSKEEKEIGPPINEPWFLFGFHLKPVSMSNVLKTVNLAAQHCK